MDVDQWRPAAVELQHAEQSSVCRGGSADHPESTTSAGGGSLRRLDRLGRGRKQSFCFFQEYAARMRQLDVTITTLQERDAQFLLEHPDLLAQRRLGDLDAPSRPRKVELLGDSDEIAQLAEVHLSS